MSCTVPYVKQSLERANIFNRAYAFAAHPDAVSEWISISCFRTLTSVPRLPLFASGNNIVDVLVPGDDIPTLCVEVFQQRQHVNEFWAICLLGDRKAANTDSSKLKTSLARDRS